MSYSRFNSHLAGMRVVKYIRCSHPGQVKEGETLEAQNQILDDFIAANKMTLVDTFVDEAMTARKKYTKRKEFMRLLDGVKAHKFDMIIFTKLDRWFRNIGDYHKIQEILEANHVNWKAVTEEYDTTTTNGRLYINIRLSVAQDESDRVSDRIRDVFSYKLKNKTYLTGNLPRGLKLDEEKHVIVDEEWRQYVNDMFDFFEACGSKRATLLYLNEKYDLNICYDTIYHNLQNPIYKGQYHDDPEFCEALIDPARFDRLQKLARHNIKVYPRRQYYIFAGLLMCPLCNHYLRGNSTYRKLASGEKKVYKAYRCRQYSASYRCKYKSGHREDRVETYLLNHLDDALKDYIASYEVSSAATLEISSVEKIAKIEKKLKKLYELFLDDLIDKDSYRAEYNKFQNEIAELKKMPVAPVVDLTAFKKLLRGDWREVYDTFTEQEKNAFFKSFIDYIYIYEDGSMDIHFL